MGNNLIKFLHRKRSKDNDEDKIQHVEPSPIFKLYGHCFDELLEYLSLKDLHSLGQTCKSMQQMTGESFTRNYSGVKFNCLRDGIYFIDTDDIPYSRHRISIDKCTAIPNFIQLITWIALENIIFKKRTHNNPHRYKNILHTDFGKFKYFKLNADELKSVTKLSLTEVRINKQTVDYIAKILPKIEVLKLIRCDVHEDLYDILLIHCKNLRSIQLSGVRFKNMNKNKNKNKYEWLLQKYEKLEQLSFNNRIEELSTFFELNPNIRHFSCNIVELFVNKDALLNCKVKLDTFEVMDTCEENYCTCAEERTAWDLLFQLHTNGFYKRLHIKVKALSYQTNCKEFTLNHDLPIQFMPRCSIPTYFNGNVPLLAGLIEYTEILSLCKIPLKKLMNVERLFLYRQWEREPLDILCIIQQLKKLRKIKLLDFETVEILDLNVLNREREKLVGARKVTIYVPDAIFLATKWATKNGTTNFNMIEMKRSNSYEWHKFCEYSSTTLYLPPGIF